MELSNMDVLKKALLDTQERVRDFEVHSKQIEDEEISQCFKKFAEQEGFQAQELQKLIENRG